MLLPVDFVRFSSHQAPVLVIAKHDDHCRGLDAQSNLVPLLPPPSAEQKQQEASPRPETSRQVQGLAATQSLTQRAYM
jgi:hypothetical protein